MPSSADEFREKLRRRRLEIEKEFKGEYAAELNELLGLSRDEIDAITPDTEDLRVYQELLAVVGAASSANVSKAQLIGRIKDMGDVAVRIAKLSPTLLALF